ncbi:male-specific lethal 1 homolog isoform X1 [Trichogramma pretiosum]|uniref:male-specific lethal 1 homolog isoform X1 n=2 Tax=Trichogramma pretiosum TaxID=7493 RepID=UPI0006C93E44|nr:male-specific lethal 1 homolog isoform X1 [Trichogramma pretiosum]
MSSSPAAQQQQQQQQQLPKHRSPSPQQQQQQQQQLLHNKVLNGEVTTSDAIAPAPVLPVSSHKKSRAPLDGVVSSTQRQRNAARLSHAKVEEETKGEVVVNNMVAAMNEHLTASSTTNSVRLTTVSSKIKELKSKDKNNTIISDNRKVVSILGYPCDFDHMYASMIDGESSTATSALGSGSLKDTETRHNSLIEVKHLKELLLLHLDLIQQQSEQIVTKDKLLTALRQENENLKMRLERMDRRVNLQKMRSDSSENANDQSGPCSPPHLNASPNSLPSKSDRNKDSNLVECISSQHNESFKFRLSSSGGITPVKQESPDKLDCKQESNEEAWDSKKRRKSELTAVNNCAKRKRGISSSSTISNDTMSTVPESFGGKGPNFEVLRKLEKKGKSLTKRESFLTSEEPYYTAVGEPNYSLCLKSRVSPEDTTSSNLEVPNWRVKVYTSCYTMEGTENLDDEIFNKRHLKLENDERRRKRWDVQRIREQRHIEKLKQRQEKQNHHAACLNLNHSGPCLSATEENNVTTLWPEIDQLQSIQVDDYIPVSAFGSSIPCYTASIFSLPWFINAKSKIRRNKRLSNRRKKSRR